MLLYLPELSRACLEHLVRLMVEHGLVAAENADPELEQCVARLHGHFGRAIAGSP